MAISEILGWNYIKECSDVGLGQNLYIYFILHIYISISILCNIHCPTLNQHFICDLQLMSWQFFFLISDIRNVC
jgi:hypothetical protein